MCHGHPDQNHRDRSWPCPSMGRMPVALPAEGACKNEGASGDVDENKGPGKKVPGVRYQVWGRGRDVGTAVCPARSAKAPTSRYPENMLKGKDCSLRKMPDCASERRHCIQGPHSAPPIHGQRAARAESHHPSPITNAAPRGRNHHSPIANHQCPPFSSTPPCRITMERVQT